MKNGGKKMSRTALGVLCTVLGGVFWGLSGSCGQFLFENYGVQSIWLTAVRMLFAGIVLTVWGLFRKRGAMAGIWKDKKDALQLITFSLLGLLFSQYTYLEAIANSNAGTATVLQYLGPVMIMVWVCLRGRKLPNAREAVSVALALTGTWLLATHGDPGSMVLSPAALFWGLTTALSLVFYTLLPVRIIGRWGSVPVTAFGMLIGGAVLMFGAGVWRYGVPLDLPGLLALSGVVLGGTVLAYTLYLTGVQLIGPVRASVLASVEPVSATIFATLWLGSPFTWLDLIGYVCILSTVFLLAEKEKTA